MTQTRAPSKPALRRNRPPGKTQRPQGPGGPFRRGGGISRLNSPRNHRDIIHRDQDSSVWVRVVRTETAVIRHFQERMPYGLFVLDLEAT